MLGFKQIVLSLLRDSASEGDHTEEVTQLTNVAMEKKENAMAA